MSGAAGKPSGLRPPSKIARPPGASGLPKPVHSQSKPEVVGLLNATRTEEKSFSFVVTHNSEGRSERGSHTYRFPWKQLNQIEDAIAHSARAAGMKSVEASQYARQLAKSMMAPVAETAGNSEIKDDFIIGDRVLVGGNKPGIIQYLGETQFAHGQWAGVVLDDFLGKNDGSVAGIRYFQCEPKRGVFAKVSKLVREPMSGASTPTGMSKPSGAPSTPRMGTKVGSKIPSTGGRSGAGEAPDNLGLKVGDRVLVSGSKLGTLRYIGTTEFAKGEWCGVELVEELGKNDGAVAGTRYFTCKPKYGLFAPIHKVTRAKGKAAKPVAEPVNKDKRSDSTSSVSSASSLSSLSRSAGQSSIEMLSPRGLEAKRQSQDSSSEKPGQQQQQQQPQQQRQQQQHKSQHAPELGADTPRKDIGKSSAQTAEFVKESESNRDSLKSLVESADKEKVELLQQLEEERRKVEDLQFRLEEAAISKDDLKAASQEELARVKTLEDRLVEENKRATRLQEEVDGFKNILDEKDFKIAELEMEASTYTEQLDELQAKCRAAEERIQQLETSQMKDSDLGEEIKQKISRIKELETEVLGLSKEKADSDCKISEVKEELQESIAARQKIELIVEELQSKLSSKETAMKNLDKEFLEVKQSFAELQRQLKSSEEKCEQLSKDKSKLESEIAELMRNSGDSSQQLSLLNERLRAKDRKLEELQDSVSKASLTISKLNDTVAHSKAESQREIQALNERHEENMNEMKKEADTMQAELQKAHAKIARLTEAHSKEREQLEDSRSRDLDELRQKLARREGEFKELSDQHNAFNKLIEQLQTEKDKYKNEKEKAQKAYKATIKERDTLKEEKERALVDIAKLEGQQQLFQLEKDHAGNKKKQLIEEKERLEEEKNKINKELEESKTTQKQLQEQRDIAMREKNEAIAKSQQSQMKVHALEEEVERQKKDVEKFRDMYGKSKEESQHGAQNMTDLQVQLEGAQHLLEGTKRKLLEIETDKSNIQQELREYHTVKEEKQQLEEAHTILKNQLEELKKRENNLRKEFNNDRESLQQNLDATNSLILQKEKEIERQKSEITSLKGESSIAKSYKTAVEELEKDKYKLQQQIEELQTALVEAQKTQTLAAHNNVNTSSATDDMNGDPLIAQLKEEKDLAEGQVNFLNSVIVDLQRKNEELQARIDAIEESGINGTDEFDDFEYAGHRMLAPRLFCDICDMFDLHDTDDCPKQAMSDSPPGSQYHGDRLEERPYCETCEVFGHWTDECDDEQTY
ncbi:CAP-Gly domain-containing linker protein 1-like isoform X3 [Ptychodera flava]|uniref:CAP-Gly domain-containing linker protein 1-like isoform X3 n=1 Tax=Ptychodera flava TaxID=63121 RepID=UPI00396A69F7